MDDQIFEKKYSSKMGLLIRKKTNISKSIAPMATKLGVHLDHMYTKAWAPAVYDHHGIRQPRTISLPEGPNTSDPFKEKNY